jgi:protein phosphatase 4 regulatory subunit 3
MSGEVPAAKYAFIPKRETGEVLTKVPGSLKYFRACIGLHDEAYERHLVKNKLFEPILNLLFETMPRDNLLNSACLELFEFIRRENRFELINHLVETYRDKLESITYVDTFQNMILKYDQVHEQSRDADTTSFTSDVGSESGLPPGRMAMVNGGRWQQGLREADPEEEAYFNSSDNEDDDVDPLSTIGAEPMAAGAKPMHAHAAGQMPNGASPVRPLVDYPDDDDDDDMDVLALPNDTQPQQHQHQQQQQEDNLDTQQPQPEPQQAQQQQQDDEDEELQQDQQAQQQLTSESRSPPATTTAAATSTTSSATPPQLPQTPPPLELKRRREDDDDDDELGKHPGGPPKRRSASFGSVKSDVSSAKSSGSETNATATTGAILRRKKGSINSGKDGAGGGAGAKKISISLAVKRAGDGE